MHASALPNLVTVKELPKRFFHAHWAIAGCGGVVALEVAVDFWQGLYQLSLVGGVLATVLVLFGVSLWRDHHSRKLELLVVLGAAAWIVSGIMAHGNDGLICAYAAVAALMLVAPTQRSEAFAVGLALFTAAFLWFMQVRHEAVSMIATILLFTGMLKLYKVGIDRQRRGLEARRAQLELLLRCSDAGWLELNESDHSIRYSPRLREMLGSSSDADEKDVDFFGLLPPGFRDRVVNAYIEQTRQVTAPRLIVELPAMEYPLVRSNGSRIWVEARAIRISTAKGGLERYICTFFDITERLETERLLRTVNAEVEERAREAMRQHAALEKTLSVREEVDRISRHDLKTPLGQIASIVDSLRGTRSLTAEEEWMFAMLDKTARRAIRMLRLTADLYRMEEGSFDFVPEPADMIEMARRVSRTFGDQASTKQVTLTVFPSSGELRAQVDLVLCETILENLLKNAIEAAPEGSCITIRIGADTQVAVSIHNEGIVSPEVQGRFFEKYATVGKVGGTGLGTYSALLMAKAQHGDLRMTTSELAGTTLTLELMPVCESIGKEAQDRAARRPIGAGNSILIVDDDVYVALAFGRMLVASGPVRSVVNGRAGIDAVKTHRPDIIFMDLEMPVMGGLEAIGQIRAVQQGLGQRPSHIVAMTADADPRTRRRCREAGFDRCVLKPLTPESIEDVMDTVAACVDTSPRHSAFSGSSMA